MLTAAECQQYKVFVDRYQSYLYPLLGTHIARTLGHVGSVIDMGTGPGYLSVELAERCSERVHAVDINPEMIAIARQVASDRGVLDKIVFELNDVHGLPYETGFADAVVSYSCFHHWADPVKGLAEVYRVLASNGKLILIDTNPMGAEFLATMRPLIAESENFRFVEEAISESYTQNRVREFAREAGIQEFSLGDFEFTEEDLLDNAELLEESPLPDDLPGGNVCWVLTAQKRAEKRSSVGPS